jgi:hypothetical protein
MEFHGQGRMVYIMPKVQDHSKNHRGWQVRWKTLIKLQKSWQEAYDIFSLSQDRQMLFSDFKKRWAGTRMYASQDTLVMITPRNEIGYYVLPESQRQGHAKRAVKDWRRIEKRPYYWALVPFKNKISMNFIQSMGFVPSAISYSRDMIWAVSVCVVGSMIITVSKDLALNVITNQYLAVNAARR